MSWEPGDNAWGVVFNIERDEILEVEDLSVKRPNHPSVINEGNAWPYDCPRRLTMEEARRYDGAHRVELWAPSERIAKTIVHKQIAKRKKQLARELSLTKAVIDRRLRSN